MKKAAYTIVFLVVLLTVILFGIWYIGIPDDYVAERVEQLSVSPLKLTIDGFRKGPFFNFAIEKILIENREQEMWNVHNFAGHINLLKLFTGTVLIDIQGESYGGSVSGAVTAYKNAQNAEIGFDNINLSDITALKEIGYRPSGKLSGSLVYLKNSGNVKFIIHNGRFPDFVQGGIYIPLKYFHTVRGALEFSPPERIQVRSLTLEGKGIYVRVKGRVIKRLADLEVEIMPEPSFPDKSLLMLIDKYKISEGYYFVPVKRRLRF